MLSLKHLFAVALALPPTLTMRAVAEPTAWELENRERWLFPPCMQVVDVKEQFGAKGDGRTDDTEALRAAFNQRGAFVYLPDGTYLVSDQIQYTHGPSIGPTLQGESRDGVVIKLADDAEGFDDPDRPRAMVRFINDKEVSADYFKNRIRNLTIDTGAHRGATGLMFYANNNGMARNLRIVGQGAIGLDLSYRLNGPLLVSNVEIDGFDVGIKAGSGPYNSQTLEHIVLRNQRRWGVDGGDESLHIRDLQSHNACPAVFTRGNMALIDSTLTGGDADVPAIVSAGLLFARNIDISDYGTGIRKQAYDRGAGLGEVTETVEAGHIDEWTSYPPVSPIEGEPIASLSLPVETAPYTPLPSDFDQWVCVDEFGADGSDDQDDTEAVQSAFDHAARTGKSVVCFAAESTYIVSGRIEIQGSVQRIQGANSYVRSGEEEARFVVTDGDPEVVLFDLLDRPLGRHKVIVENASSRTVVVRNLRGELEATGPGRTFLEDASSNIRITHPEARVWARQVNSENDERAGLNNHNRSGMLWILGLKTERNQTLLLTDEGGRSEVIGAWVYQTISPPQSPMFKVVDSAASFAAVKQYHWEGGIYQDLLEQVHDGRRATATKDANGQWSFTLTATTD